MESGGFLCAVWYSGNGIGTTLFVCLLYLCVLCGVFIYIYQQQLVLLVVLLVCFLPFFVVGQNRRQKSSQLLLFNNLLIYLQKAMKFLSTHLWYDHSGCMVLLRNYVLVKLCISVLVWWDVIVINKFCISDLILTEHKSSGPCKFLNNNSKIR